MAVPKKIVRPLSPHIQIYRWQVTMATSILTRATGNALILSALVFVWWLFAMTQGGAYFAFVDGLVHSWPGKIVIALSLWSVWYHYLAGIRHLIHDAGRGLDIATADKLSWGTIIGAFVLSILTYIVI